jgi:hypothetical protein
LEWKYKLNPSFDTAPPASWDAELIAGPRFSGSDQSEKWGPGACDERRSATTTLTATATLRKTMDDSFPDNREISSRACS